MTEIIKAQQLITSDLSFADLETFLADPSLPAVIIEPDEEVEAIAAELQRIDAIAINFPVFNDGRGYSSASMLRRKYGYSGELRAVGDVRVDELEQMVRCGFDAFQLAEGQNRELALTRLGGFTFSYQQTADRAPLFRDRIAQRS